MIDMARRKKYPKLPNGFGQIKYLGKGRRNPYAVHPPATERAQDGTPITPKALCYVDDWMKGFTVLTAFHAGNYQKGMERNIEISKSSNLSDLAQKILSDYNQSKGVEQEMQKKPTFAEVYQRFFEYKFERDKSRVYSKSTFRSTRTAFKNCKQLHDRIFADLRSDDLQKVLDDCPLKHSSLELIVSLFHQMYQYAESSDLVEKDYSKFVKINIPDDDEHGEPFTYDELAILWEHKENPVVEMILIMCYSGYRIAAYKNMEINLKEKYFYGGVKTAAGKNRYVPIHSAIYPMVVTRTKKHKNILGSSENKFRELMYETLEELHIEKHTPHDCRHTFSMLCEKFKVNENDRKRMLGHSFKNDITNGIYGHRTVEELREEIEKIKIPDVTNVLRTD